MNSNRKLIYADVLITAVLKKAIDDAFLNGNTDMHRLLIQVIAHQPAIDAVPLDGSFLKMSKGDYLIYNRHWLYEHFDMEMKIQRSAMKSMGYEPALKDAEPVRYAKNIGTDYDETDQFVCSECGIEIQGWYRVEHDEDDDDETIHEYRFRYCPHCGARIKQ